MLDLEESMLDRITAQSIQVRIATEGRHAGEVCADLLAHPAVETTGTYCPECLEEGLVWVSLRQCLVCGNIGCCDSSIGKHATGHYEQTLHPVMESAEHGEDWRWCYLHHLTA
jgi:uncharacterized UBP type Zn finger protein